MKINKIIQVAGILDIEEAMMVTGCGATHLGFPMMLDVHEEEITPAAAKSIIQFLQDQNRAVLITYLEKAKDILHLCRYLGCKTVQVHGPITTDELHRLKKSDPFIKIIKSLVVKQNNTDELLATVKICESFVDAFITDTFDPVSGASGATGKSHDWSVSRLLVESTTKPLILAGGLNPLNVWDAISLVRPAGVDAHTGLEGPDGRKDKTLVSEFVTAAHCAFREIPGSMSGIINRS